MAKKVLWQVMVILLLPALLVGCIVEETTENGEAAQTDEQKVSKDGALKDYIALANGYLRDGKRDQALRAINHGLDIDDNSAELLNVLAMYYGTDGEDELAEKQYRKAIRADSSYTASYLNYGVFLYKQKRFDEACKMFKKATEDALYTNRDDAFLNYGICLRQQGQTKEAEEAFRRSYVNNPRNARVMLEMAQLKFDAGDFEESLQYYNKLLGMTRQNARSLWLGIRLMNVTGQEDKQASYEMVLKNQFPASAEYKEWKAWSESR